MRKIKINGIKKYAVSVCILAAVILSFIGIYGYLYIPDGTLEVHYIDVGQGDAALLLTDDGAVLVDSGTGESGEKVAAYVAARTHTVDYMFLSHPHEDHIGGASDVLDTVEVKNVIMPDMTADSVTFDRFLDALERSSASLTRARAGDTYSIDGLEIEILSPFDGAEHEDANNMSIVMRADYGNTSFMFVGDAEETVERDLLDRGLIRECNVLKVGHHGSHTSSSEAFIEALSPEIAVISCGKNSYGHPHAEIVSRLGNHGAEIFRTDRNGTVVISSDGVSVSLK